MQNDSLVVFGACVIEGDSIVDEVLDVEDVEVMVMVVMDVSDDSCAGQERSVRSSCRFTLLAGAPQPARALPGCLFPAKCVS